MGKRRHIQHYRTDRWGKKPMKGQLDYGEIAINYADGDERIFIKNASDRIVDFVSQDEVRKICTRVDLGVYDSDCIIVRTVRNADPSSVETEYIPNDDNLLLSFGDYTLRSISLSSTRPVRQTDLSLMFADSGDLSSVDLSGLDTSSVDNMSAMFMSCARLESVDFGACDTSNVSDMLLMFGGCESLESLDLSGFDTFNVSNMDSMFDRCDSLRYITLGEKFFRTYEPIPFRDAENLGSREGGGINGWVKHLSETAPTITDGISRTIELPPYLMVHPLAAEHIAALQSKGYTVA